MLYQVSKLFIGDLGAKTISEAMVNQENGRAVVLGDAREKAERWRRQLKAAVPDLEVAFRCVFAPFSPRFRAFRMDFGPQIDLRRCRPGGGGTHALARKGYESLVLERVEFSLARSS